VNVLLRQVTNKLFKVKHALNSVQDNTITCIYHENTELY
jgi:hypothetical protein